MMVLGTEGLPEPQTSTSFPEIQNPGLGRGRMKDCVCVCGGGILKDFSILMKTLSNYSVCITF